MPYRIGIQADSLSIRRGPGIFDGVIRVDLNGFTSVSHWNIVSRQEMQTVCVGQFFIGHGPHVGDGFTQHIFEHWRSVGRVIQSDVVCRNWDVDSAKDGQARLPRPLRPYRRDRRKRPFGMADRIRPALRRPRTGNGARQSDSQVPTMLDTITNPSSPIGIAPSGGHYSHAVRSGDLGSAKNHNARLPLSHAGATGRRRGGPGLIQAAITMGKLARKPSAPGAKGTVRAARSALLRLRHRKSRALPGSPAT